MIKMIAAATAAALVGVASAANATDLYNPPSLKDVPVVAPAPVWTGLYAGFHLGAAWTDVGIQQSTFYYGGGQLAQVPVNNLVSATGFGGGQFGYNWQFPGGSNLLLGFELDIDGIGGNNERSATAVIYKGQAIQNVLGVGLAQNGGFAGDFTGRLGYAWGNWLLYAKGGFAWFSPELQARATIWGPTGVATLGNNYGGDLTGWTVGAGIEWLLNPNWSVKAEYLYYDFGVNNTNWLANTAIGADNSWRWSGSDLTVNTIKLGLNYHLTSSYTSLK